MFSDEFEEVELDPTVISQLADEIQFKLGYLQGFRSCLAAVQRAVDGDIESHKMLWSLQGYLDHLKAWHGGQKPKPVMKLWRG